MMSHSPSWCAFYYFGTPTWRTGREVFCGLLACVDDGFLFWVCIFSFVLHKVRFRAARMLNRGRNRKRWGRGRREKVAFWDWEMYFPVSLLIFISFCFFILALVKVASVFSYARHKNFQPRRHWGQTFNCELSVSKFSRQKACRPSRHSLQAQLQGANPWNGSTVPPIHVTW